MERRGRGYWMGSGGDVEMGDGLEGVAGAPGPTADLTGKQPLEVFEELFTPEIANNIDESVCTAVRRRTQVAP